MSEFQIQYIKEGICQVTRKCLFDNETYTSIINAEYELVLYWFSLSFQNRPSVQNAFPYLSADEREFLMTGTPPELWDEMMG